jgi:hypothetical protein
LEFFPSIADFEKALKVAKNAVAPTHTKQYNKISDLMKEI